MQNALQKLPDGYSSQVNAMIAEAAAAVGPHAQSSWLPWVSPLLPNLKQTSQADLEEIMNRLIAGDLSGAEFLQGVSSAPAAGPSSIVRKSSRSAASAAASSVSQPFEVVGSDVEMQTPPKAEKTHSFDWLKETGKGKGKAKDVATGSKTGRSDTVSKRDPMDIPEGAVLVRGKFCVIFRATITFLVDESWLYCLPNDVRSRI